MTALSQARAELAELEALHKSMTAEVEAQQAAIVPVAAKRDRYIKVASRDITVSTAGGTRRLGTMADLRPEHYTAQNVAQKLRDGTAKPKSIRESLADGGFKVNWGGGYGVSLTIRGLAQRVRRPHPEDVKAYTAAVKKRERAEKVAADARAAEAAALQRAYDNGTKITGDEMVELAYRRTIAEVAVMAMPLDHKAKHDGERMMDEHWGEIPLARRHVAHLSKKVEDPECRVCKLQAERSAKADELRARVEALPRKKFTCPTHGRKIGHHARERGRFEDQEWTALPVIYCPIDLVRYVDGKVHEADKVKVAKAEARAAKAKPAPAPERFEWTCPSCEEDVEGEAEEGYVVCDLCEASITVETARRLQTEEGRAA